MPLPPSFIVAKPPRDKHPVENLLLCSLNLKLIEGIKMDCDPLIVAQESSTWSIELSFTLISQLSLSPLNTLRTKAPEYLDLGV